MRWDKSEMGNQYGHSAVARGISVLLLALIFWIVGNPVFTSMYPFISLIIFGVVGVSAFLIELIQFIFFDNFDAKLPDRIRDWSFYVVESVFVLTVFYYGIQVGIHAVR